MSTKHTLLAALAAAIALASCSKSDPEQTSVEPVAPEATPAPPAADENADPTVVDADHYKTEFENDRVRIVRITYGPGEDSVMHYHPDNVAVFLTDNTVEMTLPSGERAEATAKAGDTMFEAGGSHLPRNVSDAALELVLVELKSGGSSAAGAGGEDPTVVDADHYTAEFENENTRVVRIAYGAGEESVMHYHPDSVAVFLTDHLVLMTTPDGETSEVSSKAGEAIFLPEGQHLPKNISDAPWELILVELK